MDIWQVLCIVTPHLLIMDTLDFLLTDLAPLGISFVVMFSFAWIDDYLDFILSSFSSFAWIDDYLDIVTCEFRKIFKQHLNNFQTMGKRD